MYLSAGCFSPNSLVSTVRNLLSVWHHGDLLLNFIGFRGMQKLKEPIRRHYSQVGHPSNSHPLSVSFKDLKSIIKQKLLLLWQNIWDKKINNKLQEIKLFVTNGTFNHCSTKREDVVFARLRIGHNPLTHTYVLMDEDSQFVIVVIVPLLLSRFYQNVLMFLPRVYSILTNLLVLKSFLAMLLNLLAVLHFYQTFVFYVLFRARYEPNGSMTQSGLVFEAK